MQRYTFLLFLLVLFGCSSEAPVAEKQAGKHPDIFPNYVDCTIPLNIAPLNFRLNTPYEEAYAVLRLGDEAWTVKANKKQFTFPASAWKRFLEQAAGKTIEVTVIAKEQNVQVAYTPFFWTIPQEKTDPYIAYRLIEPGYASWNRMGIYQRDLESYTQTPIMENRHSENNCMNCHSFCMQDPQKMLFHMRADLAGTYLIQDDVVEKLNTKTDKTISALVYPAWHPSGRFIAFSVNDTRQAFHMNSPNRVEVYDTESDVVVYDTEQREVITNPALFSKQAFETFPSFSPDGKTMYFCSAEALDMPLKYDELKYSLCAIAFDPATRRFGTEVDTLYNVSAGGRSASFPRVSPDGKFLLYTLSDYGNFSIWHQDADLYMINLASGVHYPLDNANSNSVESYHSWSSNSRWVVFSSRRLDGLYTRPHITYINEQGEASKAFIVPQKETDYYHRLMKSYNIPEFITGKVSKQSYNVSSAGRNDPGIDVTFGGMK